MPAQVHVLQPGYSRVDGSDCMTANGSSTLIFDSGQKIVVDTLSPWDAEKLTELLAARGAHVDDIDVAVCTHPHPDHVGNMNLFTKARLHVSGFSVYCGDTYTFHPFQANVPLPLTENVSVIPTPGHTLSCVSVVVRNVEGMGTVVVAGDLFEKEEDLRDESIWLQAGSEDAEKQRSNRTAVLRMADFIVPGHGDMFKVHRE